MAFLASPRASWISGTSVVVDGCQVPGRVLVQVEHNGDRHHATGPWACCSDWTLRRGGYSATPEDDVIDGNAGQHDTERDAGPDRVADQRAGDEVGATVRR